MREKDGPSSEAAPPKVATRVLAAATIARVATLTASDTPHVAPYWFHWDGERIVLDTLENRTVRNLWENDRVSVLVEAADPGTYPAAVLIRGRARCYAERKATPAVQAAVEAIRAAHQDEVATPIFEAYAAAETRPLVYVEIMPVAWAILSPHACGESA